MSAGRQTSARNAFLAVWALLLLTKLALLVCLPPFVDEAFYAWESRHLAWAYSDLPGMTAWLIALGQSIGGEGVFGMRWLFWLLGAVIPWQVWLLARRWFGAAAGWQAAMLASLMPLTAVSGVMALPDVPLVFAALLCVDAMARLLQRVDRGAALQLAVGLAMGAFTHYRFAAVILAGIVGVLLSPVGRALLREPRVWMAVGVGAAAWLPLLWWNLEHGAAGLSFQLVERHPWRLHAGGAIWPLVQLLVVTPGLLLLLLLTLSEVWRRWRAEPSGKWGLLLGAGGIASIGFMPLAFMVDSERLSLHWPHAGWLLLAVAAPSAWQRWPGWARLTTCVMAALGAATVLLWLAIAGMPQWRTELAASSLHPGNFSGWNELATTVAEQLEREPTTRIIADNFKVGAQLAFALRLGDEQLAVLRHPLNDHHGRTGQLRQWDLLREPAQLSGQGPALLVVEDTARPLKDRLVAYQEQERAFNGLPLPEVLNIDHGRKRFLLYGLHQAATAPGTTPALAYIDAPLPGAEVGRHFELRGWAFKDAVGLQRIEVTLDGHSIAQAQYGASMPGVAEYWRVSTDPQHPNVGFRLEVDLGDRPPGRYWLGLVLHGRDGSYEPWPAQPIELR
ncbi:MAG TPA: glycosyltransferase family 39 protein [Arenimonas sp.]|nr:glycosyltransferase family 39 protein [Arenimonas sp.]